MEKELARYFELLERRLSTMHLLATALEESQTALTQLELDAIHQHAAQQENLCTEIHFLDHELEFARNRLAQDNSLVGSALKFETLIERLDLEPADRLRSLARDLEETQTKVRHLNRVHTALLRRSRRSVNVLMNFLTSYSATYGPTRTEEFVSSTPVTVKV